MRVTVRDDGAALRAAPEPDARTVTRLSPGDLYPAGAALLTPEALWLRVQAEEAGPAGGGWVAAEDTDFARGPAYAQVADAWFESEPVLALRRRLVQDLLQLRKSPAGQVAYAATLAGDELRTLEERLAGSAVLSGYRAFWDLREPLGLPEPFEHLPVHILPPADITRLVLDGFGPNTVAARHGDIYYPETREMAPGLEYTVPEGAPLIAVADGVIVEFTFMEHPAARSLALRPYLPPRFRAPNGARALSNVIIAYGNLMGDPPGDHAQVGDVVRAGDVIGTSGWPVYTRGDGSVGVQGNNAHLRIEAHFVTDGQTRLDDKMPVNPLLLWSPRLVAFQARLAAQAAYPPYPRDHALYGRLGFFSLGAFRTDIAGSVWDHAPAAQRPWPDGVYTLDALVDWARDLPAYPLDGTGEF